MVQTKNIKKNTLNDTYCDMVALNDGSVAVLPQAFDKMKNKGKED